MTISAVTSAAIGAGRGAHFQDAGRAHPHLAGHDLEVRHLQPGIDGGGERELAVDRDRVRDRGRVVDGDGVALKDANHVIAGRDLSALQVAALDQLPLATVWTYGRDVSCEKSGMFSGSVKADTAAVSTGAMLCACVCTAALWSAVVCATTVTLEGVAHVRTTSAAA